MTASHRMSDVAQIKAFVRGGNARFTLVSVTTGNRVTYRVRASDDGKVHFVKVLTGPDNGNSYTFLGTIFYSGEYHRGRTSPIGADAMSARAFQWFFDRVADGDIDGLEFWHEGRCGRCGRALTVPESIATGFGPECAGKVGLRGARQVGKHPALAAPYGETNVPGDPYEFSVAAIRADADRDEALFAQLIQQRERDEEVRRMNRKFGLPQDYRPAGWMPR